MTGEIRPGDYDRLIRFANRDVHRFHASTIVLASPGGNVIEAMRIGGLIKKTYQSVFVNHKLGNCASACFFIYVAAVQRDATVPSLGIHRPYFPPSEFHDLSLSQSQARHRTLSESVRRYLSDQEVPQYLIERMFSLASTEVYWLSRDDLNAIGFRANWWDQVLVERCKLDKRLESDFMSLSSSALPNHQARDHLWQVGVCAYEISEIERKGYLRELLQSVK